MIGPWFWQNGQLLPATEAVVGLDDLNYAYGFGVYETLKVRHGRVHFPAWHEERLWHSAAVIGLEHVWPSGTMVRACQDLVAANQLQDANLKVLLVAGDSPANSRLAILALAPLFPDRKLYRDGALASVYRGERLFPQAKTLNMLLSVLAYRDARAAGAYDALLVDREDRIAEGTRTNVLAWDGQRFLTPPAERVLEGVTRRTVIMTIRDQGWPLEERDLVVGDLDRAWSWFLTSTSTKILPLRQIGDRVFPLSEAGATLMAAYDQRLRTYSETGVF